MIPFTSFFLPPHLTHSTLDEEERGFPGVDILTLNALLAECHDVACKLAIWNPPTMGRSDARLMLAKVKGLGNSVGDYTTAVKGLCWETTKNCSLEFEIRERKPLVVA